MEPLKVVAVTPPVEATIRILLNSVPYLIGAAVIRQPAGPEGVAAEVGRNPWLFDRRLTSLELPDDALPANRAVALDWPVPFQAEWVGVPPRLLISRLVFGGRTVGVLLGTLITREQLGPQTREAIDLSCELIASAVAMDSPAMYVAPEPQIHIPDLEVPSPPPRIELSEPAPAVPQWAVPTEPAVAAPGWTTALEPPAAAPDPATPPLAAEQVSLPDTPGRTEALVEEVARAVAVAGDARAIGRVLRDAMNAVTAASAFAVALFHADRPEVTYRYKVVAIDAASSELGRQPVDDGARCDAIRGGQRWHAFERWVALGAEQRRVAVVQVPLHDGGVPIGVVTVQTFREGEFAPAELALIAAIVDATRVAFAAARAGGRFQPPAEPEFTLPRPHSAGTDPVAASAAAPADSAAPAASAAPPPAGLSSSAEILTRLLDRFASAGSPTAFIVGLDVAAGMLRGERSSGSAAAAELDTALGISAGRFAVSLDDRSNAIARACREARVVAAPTVHELLPLAYEWSDALVLERLVGGHHSTIIPIAVSGSVVGAIVAGPAFEAPDAAAIERLQAFVADAARELTGAWRAASIGGAAGQVVADDERVRAQAGRSVA